jgi:hypothetical protein
MLGAGTFNAGCVAVADSRVGRSFLDWWSERLRLDCLHDLAAGLHGDQRWLDLVPGMFGETAVVRDPRCNVAYWNLADRADEKPRFFHFSGFDPRSPEIVSRHAPGLTTTATGPFEALFVRYARRLHEEGLRETIGRRPGFSQFDNGVAIPEPARWAYADLGENAASFGDPFATGEASFFRWLNAVPSGDPLPPLWSAVYRRRSDLRRAFPDIGEANRAGFIEWASDFGLREHSVPEAFLPREWRR